MSIKELSCMGGAPEFKDPIPFGQLYFPSWERYEAAMYEIFKRQYYTNQGVLTDLLEDKLQNFLNIDHVICVTNETIGLIMAAEALGLSGKVITPAHSGIASPLSILRCGLEPVFCDVDLQTQHVTPETLEESLVPGVSAILGVNLWGSLANTTDIAKWAKNHSLKVYWDSSQAMGCSKNNKEINTYESLEVFSLHSTQIINSGEGGCIATNNANLADKLRNIRSSYGVTKKVSVVKTSNGRMSEFQAALALMSLNDFDKNRYHNSLLRNVYKECLQSIPGVRLEPLYGVTISNQQNIVIRIDKNSYGLSRNALMEALIAENVIAQDYFQPSAHKFNQFSCFAHSALPNTDTLSKEILVLPTGSYLSEKEVQRICKLIKIIGENGKK